MRSWLWAFKVAVYGVFKTAVRFLKRAGVVKPVTVAIGEVYILASKWRGIEKRHPGKPLIMLLADVRGWAWDTKAGQIQKYLSDEFDFDILYWADFRWRHFGTYVRHWGHDLYFTFEFN